MKIRKEIEISPESEKYFEYLKEYQKIDELPEILNGRTIIHLYPFRDSLKSNGKSTGYREVLESKVVIYNLNMAGRKIKYESSKLHDMIDLHVPCKVTYFKDLSTMIEVESRITIELSQKIIVYTPLKDRRSF